MAQKFFSRYAGLPKRRFKERKMKISLEDTYKKLVKFLNKEGVEYIIIGGIAAGVLGEPRMTGDIDVDVVLENKKLAGFLNNLKKTGFNVNIGQCIKRVKEAGVFQIKYGDLHVDFIIASIDLEKEAIRRKKIIKLYGLKTFFPTMEDFILLKIIPGRTQDLLDIEKVIARHKGKLDIKYLMNWARELSDEAQDMRIYNKLRDILGKA